MDFNARAKVLALCLCISGSASASDSGFYFGVNVGQSDFDVDRSDVGVAFVPFPLAFVSPLPPAAFVGGFAHVDDIYTATAFEPSLPGAEVVGASEVELHHVDKTLSATVGYQVNAFFAAELSYVDLGTVEMRATFPSFSLFPVLTPSSMRQSTDIEVTGIQLSVLGRWPITPAWSVFGKVGYLFADADVDFAVRMEDSTSHFDVPKVSSENIALGAGIDFNFASKWIARLEYQRHLDVGGDAFIHEPDADSVSLGVFLRL